MSLDRLSLLKGLWSKDCIIDPNNVDDEIVRVPKLHQKYLDLLTDLKVLVFRKQADFLKLKGARSRYYSGSMGKDELQEFGWEQYQGKTPLKSELERLLEVDPVLLVAEENLFELKACFEYVEEVMKSLRYRAQELRTIYEFRKFIAGN